MKKSTVGSSWLLMLLASLMLMSSATLPANALTAKGVLENGSDHVHFDLTLTVNMTITAFNITRKWFEENEEAWKPKWDNWKHIWEEEHEEWHGKWSEQMRGWKNWTENNSQSKIEWEHKWKQEWAESWNEKWSEQWDEWEQWMDQWEKKWDELKFEDLGKIPDFMKPSFKEKMMEKFDELWNKHVNAPTLSRCWTTPASQLGLKNALGQSINRTLQWLYNSTDVYIKNFDLTVETASKTILVNGTYMATGLYNLTEGFDVYGIVINNASGTFIRSYFRYLNVTEKVDGGKFSFPGWVFTPSKAMFMDLSVFSVPLQNWSSTFDPGTNATTFTLIKDINVTTPYGNVIIDPEMVLVVPGRAMASGDIVYVVAILPSDLLPIKFVTVATVVATIVFAGYYLTKRRTTITIPTPRLA